MPRPHRLAARLCAAALMLGALLVPQTATAATTTTACPGIFAHGGYPTGPQAWERDRIRQPNNPAALRDYRSMGAVGVEADLQLTRDGTKAVMWHNDTTTALTGSGAHVNTLWWNTGWDRLNGRTIEVGPYRGERVYTLRQYLDAVHGLDMVPLIEIRSPARQSLLHSDSTIRNRAWAEVLDPISERIDRQEIMLYTHNDAIRPELLARAQAAGLGHVVSYGSHRPVWPDTVPWEEPPPSATGNHPAWQAALDKAPRRMATSWPAQMRDWMKGRCG
ncbi:glycerophosphoryl diester phosphodiesterase [Stackebrandtia albiflava]|uniref:Glycerophosphoryl diester phosphodiesterase n=1 Tax=Stackebrandtia albiflava TaxID=406432 RepID=A0A562UR96_9ACTN|nr:glycerophosphodiester phosphodiesterase family protein [Stackebrandtia albiflava]TWJ08136.1 glycerophosphoryl diester phosphodiesterase [Stackebrandtia albiflava]